MLHSLRQLNPRLFRWNFGSGDLHLAFGGFGLGCVRSHKLQHVGPLERVNPALAQLAHSVKIGRHCKAVLLDRAARHAQLASGQTFLADRINIDFCGTVLALSTAPDTACGGVWA
jgi:hypothetical protein